MKPGVLPLVCASLLAGCGEQQATGIERADFIATYIDLREATVAGTLDSIARDSILEAHGTTEAGLRAYIEAHSDDPDALADTWREIMDSVAARDSTAAARDSAAAETDTL